MMRIPENHLYRYWKAAGLLVFLALAFLAGCQPMPSTPVLETPQPTSTPTPVISPTPLPERAMYSPGELVDYTAQTGDTLVNLAVRFNTTVEEIRAANSIIPPDSTTLPSGMPMQIPIYYEPFWGTPYQILPNSQFVNGPAQVGFDVQRYLEQHPGWLNNHEQYAAKKQRSGAEIVEYIAQNFSVSPRLLLALLEYQTGAVTNPVPPENLEQYPLGYAGKNHKGLYMQLIWAANTLNNGYYGWLTGHLDTLEFLDDTIERPDPWQNAATVALQYYFSRNFSKEVYSAAISPEGFAGTYEELFGDPWTASPHIPGSLTQPALRLPFEKGETWALTGGPHTGWGKGEPWSALDFAPPGVSGCNDTNEWAVAVAPGVVSRSEPGIVELDLDGDGDSRTGWVIFYLHIATRGRVEEGKQLQAGDPVGHPSCEGGSSTGTHIHIARKYNGEWIPAEGPLAFDLSGWVAANGSQEYQGMLVRYSQEVIASDRSDSTSHLTAGE
jgi:murein DD-endopeptidase MepM/ murein hydrolase activator NlpD